MNASQAAVVLVGHGGLPKDCPPELVQKFKQLEGRRRVSGQPPSEEELELDRQIREWPRSPESDPYQAGLLALAGRLAPLLNGIRLEVAYNEFCAPDLIRAVEKLIAEGVKEITVVPTMFTPGGSHSEVEIPEILRSLRANHPEVRLRYAWPFDLERLAEMLVTHLRQFGASGEST